MRKSLYAQSIQTANAGWLDLSTIKAHIQSIPSWHSVERKMSEIVSKDSSSETITPSKPAGIFSLTKAAAERITTMLSAEPDGSFFRVAVLGGGCSGFQYQFSIDTNRDDEDCVFTSHDVDVVIDDMSLELVDHAELDYVQDLMGAYFAVNNPNATASCGCGTSFSV